MSQSFLFTKPYNHIYEIAAAESHRKQWVMLTSSARYFRFAKVIWNLTVRDMPTSSAWYFRFAKVIWNLTVRDMLTSSAWYSIRLWRIELWRKPRPTDYVRVDIIEFINDRYLFFRISNYDDFLEADKATCTSNLYRFDIETGELKFIERYVFRQGCTISPDGKYLIYTPPLKDRGDLTTGNNLRAMEYGFYIKNIQDGTTVFTRENPAMSTQHWNCPSPCRTVCCASVSPMIPPGRM